VALTAPYQHDGSEATLREVVGFYNLGGRDPRSCGTSLDIPPLNLSERDMDELVAFLHALTRSVDVQIPPTPARAGTGRAPPVTRSAPGPSRCAARAKSEESGTLLTIAESIGRFFL
jgi:hypothetical protein